MLVGALRVSPTAPSQLLPPSGRNDDHSSEQLSQADFEAALANVFVNAQSDSSSDSSSDSNDIELEITPTPTCSRHKAQFKVRFKDSNGNIVDPPAFERATFNLEHAGAELESAAGLPNYFPSSQSGKVAYFSQDGSSIPTKVTFTFKPDEEVQPITFSGKIVTEDETYEDMAIHKREQFRVKHIEYQDEVAGWVKMPSPLNVIHGQTINFRAISSHGDDWPALPEWSGTSGASGTKKEISVTFDKDGAATQTISSTVCGVVETGTVKIREVAVNFSADPIRTGFLKLGNKNSATSNTIVTPFTATVFPHNKTDDVEFSKEDPDNRLSEFTVVSRDPSTGTVNFRIKAQKESAVEEGDVTIRAKLSGTDISETKVVVLIPKAVGTPHDVRDFSQVTPTSDRTTSPAAPTPQGKVSLATAWLYWLTIQVVYQFGRPLTSVYQGADIFEKNNINQDLTPSGTYQDPVGKVQLNVFENPVDKNGPLEKEWLDRVPQPLLSFRETQNIDVWVGGHPLSPAIVGREVIASTELGIKIVWPN